MMPHERLTHVLGIIRSLKDFDPEKLPTIAGRFESKAALDSAISFLSTEFSGQDLDVSSDQSDLTLSFYRPDSIHYSLDRYLHYPTNRKRPILQPVGFIETNEVFNPHTPMQDRVAKFNYLENVIDLFNQIKTLIADYHVDKGSDTILFFTGKTKLEVTDEYGEEDLIELAKMKEFKRDFLSQDDPHTKQRKDIFKKSIISFFEGHEKINFSEFIQGFDRICEDAHNNLVLYLDDFAFDKIKQTIEKDKLEHITRLSKVFSDIQNQLFGAPISVVIVASQIQSGEAVKNGVVLAGSILYTLFMCIAIYNQFQTLKAIKTEFKTQLSLLNSRQVAVRDLFISAYKDLEKRADGQRNLLIFSCVLVGSGCLLTLLVFCASS